MVPFSSDLLVEFLLRNQLIILWEFCCMLFIVFPVSFNILSLCFIFVSLITMFLSVFLSGFILPGILCSCWTWLTISPVREVFSCCLFNFFLGSLSLSLLLSGTPIMWICCPRGLIGCLHFNFLNFFIFLYSVLCQWFPPFRLPGQLIHLLLQLMCGPGACKMLFVSSKNEVCFPQFCGNPVIKSHWLSKSVSWGFLISARSQG